MTMSVLTEHIVLSRSRVQDLCSVKKLNCWGSSLTDVSIIRKMKFVEVLCLSLNNIQTLADFAYCPCLKELYLRKNNIEKLSELCYLKNLPLLHSLWLEDNPCAKEKNYRFTVLRVLPNLKVLDNVPVNPKEVAEAATLGDTLNFTTLEDSTEHKKELLPVVLLNETDVQAPLLSPYADTHFQPAHVTVDPINFAEIDLDVPHSPINSSNVEQHQACYGDEDLSMIKPDEPVEQINKNIFHEHQKAFHAKVQTMVDHPMPKNKDMSRLSLCSSSLDVSAEENISDYVNDLNSACVMDVSFHKLSQNHHINENFMGASSTNEGILTSDDLLSSPNLHKSWKNVNSNLLSAVLCLIKELDYASLEVVRSAVLCRMDEIE